jgi:hypothetical protein
MWMMPRSARAGIAHCEVLTNEGINYYRDGAECGPLDRKLDCSSWGKDESRRWPYERNPQTQNRDVGRPVIRSAFVRK